MTEQIDDGGPQFPNGSPFPKIDGDKNEQSLRDWFAGQALVGIVAAGKWDDAPRYAEACYLLADAMLAARKAKQ